MNIKSLVFATCLMTASLAHAQNLQTIKLPPPGQLEAVQVDQNAVAIRKLEIENQKLREENAALKQRIENFTRLGGSEVHAYCPSAATSRNTAGAESNCAAGGYSCEPVTGLCRESCDTSAVCAATFKCVSQRCVPETSLISEDGE
jgi:hypothetical protein